MAEEIDVPPYFLCPISLEIMKDPVTITTGITYDRENIEKWIFASKKKTCPVTKQPISQLDALVFTPNHTLRRLIQSWCCLNASYGIERFPTPKPPVSTTQITKLLNQARNCPHLRMTSLKELKSIANESGANRRSLEAAPGVMEYLFSTVVESSLGTTEAAAITCDDDDLAEAVVEEAGDDEVAGSGRKYLGDEALNILYLLQISESGLKTLGSQKDGIFIEALANILGQGNYASRAYAIKLMRSVLQVAEPAQLASLKPNLFTELIQVIGDRFSSKSTKSALKLLIHILPWGRNRIRATEAGAVAVMIDHLIDSDTDKRSCEMMLMVLDQICGSTAEGRAELLKHGAGLAVVSKRILRVSRFATEKAVKILFAISRFSATAAVLQEMLQFGVVTKLCLVLQVDSDPKTKDRARAILKSHAKAWRTSPCVPSSLAWAFPS